MTHQSGFTETTYRSADGLTLYARDYDTGNGRALEALPIVCLPGLTRNSRDFHHLALRLSTHPHRPFRVVTLDYRGRGQSDRDENKDNYNLVTEAQDVLRACGAFNISKAIFIGTSRGGLILHILTGMRPELLGGLILNDIGPRIETTGLKAIRDYLRVRHLPADWPTAAAQLRAVHGAAFPLLENEDWREMAEAIYAERNGVIEPDFDNAIAEQLQSADLEQPLPDLWAQFDNFPSVPLMIVRGEHTTLLSVDTVHEMARRHAGTVIVTAQGQGHAPLLHLGDLPVHIEMFLHTVCTAHRA